MEEELPLMLAGRPVTGVKDRLRRYCGLEWSGGPPEVWAYAYYDALPTDPDRVEPADVLAAAALHPGLSRDDLTFFATRRAELETWLADIPHEARLHTADEALFSKLDELLVWTDEVSLGLLTKVLHRKRPALIPLVDRVVLDWYRPVTGERSANAAWPKLTRQFWGEDEEDRKYNLLVAVMAAVKLSSELGDAYPSPVRAVDIALWMGAQQ